jgi:acyl carrier protein
MGLDAVELVMAFEEEFGVEIDDADAELLATPRDVTAYIIGRVRAGDGADRCWSMPAFHRVRRALMAHAGVSRAAVQLDVSLLTWMPGDAPRRLWPQLAGATGCDCARWPALVHSPRQLRWLGAVSTAVALASGVLTWHHRGSSAGAAAACCMLVLAFVGGLLVTLPWRAALPPAVVTIRDLVSLVAAADRRRKGSWTAAQVRQRVREIVVDILGVPDDFRDDARFIEDLGAG